MTADPAQTLSARSRYRFVFFDVDSTLVTIEGIDVLSGGDPAIAELTAAAMNGDIPLDEVYSRRLEIIRPTRDAVDNLGRNYLENLVEGAEQTIRALRNAGAIVHLVTGGIEQAIAPLASRLEIPARAVHAVRLEFAGDGSYAGYDRRSFLTRPGGKELVVRDVRARTHGKAAFVGDGVSDLEARPAVDFFVGFGGVHTRPRVKENADAFVAEPRLTAVLPYLIEGNV